MRARRSLWAMIAFLLLFGMLAQAEEVVVEIAPPPPAFPPYSARQLLLFALTVECSTLSVSSCDAGPRKSVQEQQQELRQQYDATRCAAEIPFHPQMLPPPPANLEERVRLLLAAMASAQSPDGSWQQDRVVTAWCMLAMLDTGSSIRIGMHRKTLKRAQPWVLARMEENGGVYGTSVYENQLGVRVLASSLMMEESQKLPQLPVAGKRLIARQNPDGSWGERQSLEWGPARSLVWRDEPARRLPLTALTAQTVRMLYSCGTLEYEVTEEPLQRATQFSLRNLSPCGLMDDPAGVPSPLATAAAFFIFKYGVAPRSVGPRAIAPAVFLHNCTEEYLRGNTTDGAFYALFSGSSVHRRFNGNPYFFRAVNRRGLQYLFQVCFPDESGIPAPRQTPVDLPGL